MFDSVTAALLRSAPALPGLSPDDLPSLFTLHYTELVSVRLRGDSNTFNEQFSQEWTLDKIADAYELLVSTLEDSPQKRASAYVAATAHQILSRQNKENASTEEEESSYGITRDAVPSDVAAALLFLIAEQYADAHEASLAIDLPDAGLYESRILIENIRDLTNGQLHSILERAARWRKKKGRVSSLQEQALRESLNALITGVEMLAANILNKDYESVGPSTYDSAELLFEHVIALSYYSRQDFIVSGENPLFSLYPGPRHLASLLLAGTRTLEKASLAKIPPPNNVDSPFWSKWIRHRAEQYPFLWPNHQEAIGKNFYDTGKSAVLVLPTGAGKTTVSSLKIAAVLASGKRVIFLAPTHALVDQMATDLQEMLPNNLYETAVGTDFDLSFFTDFELSSEIEVMTPERCLALLSFAPETFADVGLLVFDECHMLSPEKHDIRRAVDSMLCVLAFNSVVSDADMLFYLLC